MAQGKSTKVSNAPSVKLTASQLREWYERNKTSIENYAKAKEAIRLKDPTKSSTKTISTFNKETLRTYLQNITSNEKNLRNLSRYLYYRSQAYMRLVNFYANMFCLDARSVIPTYDITKTPNKNKLLKSYYQTLKVLDNMHLQQEFLSAYKTCFIEDVFYGIVFYDDTGIFIYKQDPDYCKITGKYLTGDLAYALDMSYYRNRQDVLNMVGDPLVSMYAEYQSTGNKWQQVPDENCLCLKFGIDELDIIVPPICAMFNSIINLSDTEDVEAIADAQDIYKMIWIELKTLGQEMDDWKIDPDVVIEYFNRMVSEALPDYVSAAIVPGEINTVNFSNDTTNDTSKVAKATEAVFNMAGGAEILNGSTISGTTAFKAAEIANTEYAISSLLPQTQSWVNRFLTYHITNPCKVRFFPISVYTKDDFRKELLTAAQNGLPTKLAYNSLNGFSALDTMALSYLEEDILGLTDKLKPLKTSYTQSSADEVGRPTTDDADLTDTTEESREKKDRL